MHLVGRDETGSYVRFVYYVKKERIKLCFSLYFKKDLR